jgi:hypothetical protein
MAVAIMLENRNIGVEKIMSWKTFRGNNGNRITSVELTGERERNE